MNRILLSIIAGGIVCTYSTCLYAQYQSPVYASQAGTMQPYNSNNDNQDNNNGYNNNGYGNGNFGYENYNNQSYDNNNQQYGNNYNNDNQQNYNNNQQNNNWQNQYNNQYGGYNNNNQGVTNVSYNNNNGYNNQQNNNKSRSQNNPFLVNYARKNKRFSATVYKMDKNGKLYRSQFDSKSLQKAIVIFFGDWCPHCAHFLTSFAKYINQLTSSGIKIIFIGVPSIERIQNWQSPTISDYNESQNKLQSFGINPAQMSQNAKSGYEQAKQQKKNKQHYNADILKLNMPAVELVLLGDNSVLDHNAIDSLPTMLAINNGTEQFRGGADNSLDVVNFENPVSMQQFQEIWYEEDDDDEDTEADTDYDEDDDDEEDTKKKVKKNNKSKKDKNKKKKENSDKKNKKKAKTNDKKNNNNKNKNSKISKESSNKQVDVSLTNFHTRLLNKGCNCSCNMPQVVIKHVRVPVQARIVQQPAQTQKVVCIPQSQMPVNTQPVPQPQQTTVVTKTISNPEVDEQFIEEEYETVPSKKKKCMRRNPRPLCSSRLKQKGNKMRQSIETAIEKHENNRCYCN